MKKELFADDKIYQYYYPDAEYDAEYVGCGYLEIVYRLDADSLNLDDKCTQEYTGDANLNEDFTLYVKQK